MAFAEIEYDRLKTKELGLLEIKAQGKRVKREAKERLRNGLNGVCERKEIKELMGKISGFLKTQENELKRLMTEKNQVILMLKQ